MGTGHRSRGSGEPPLTPEERKPPLRERSEAHLLVREAAEEVAEELHDEAPEGEVSADGATIQRSLHGWGTPLREGTVGGPPSRERCPDSNGTDSGGAASPVAVGSVGGAVSGGAEAAVGSGEPAVGAVALSAREESAVLDEQISDLPGLGAGRLAALHGAGYTTPADVLQASTEELMDVDSIGEAVAERVEEAVVEEYDRPEDAIDYGLGLGEGTSPEDLPDWGQRFTDDISDDAADVIGSARFEVVTNEDSDAPVEWLDTTQLDQIDDPQKREALEHVETLYHSCAAKMTAHAVDEDLSREVFGNVERTICMNPRSNRSSRPSHRPRDGRSQLRIPAEGIELDLMHEFGHATTYYYGYDVTAEARDAMDEYTGQRTRENPDPYVYVDPDDPDYHLLPDHGERDVDAPAEFETLIDRTNEAWQRVHRAADRGENPEKYVANLNYSAPSATEYFAVMHSFLQADERTLEDPPDYDFEARTVTFLMNQPEVAKAYFEVFEPGDVPHRFVQALRADPSMESPYDDYQFPSER